VDPVSKRVELLAWLGGRIGKPPGFERVARRLVPLERCAAMPEICLVRDGSVFVTRPGVPVGWHVAFFGSYEPELRDVMRVIVPPGGVAIDVGANVGWHTLLLARLVGGAGRVLAVEANPSVREQLAQNIGLNRLAQVEIIPCAAAAAEGSLRFAGPAADDPGAGNGHVVKEEAAAAGVISVPARPLDAVVAERRLERLDFIKIDVEGFEWPVLQGAEQTIAKHRPNIIFEFDSAYVARGDGSAALLAEFLARHRYRLFSIGRNWAERVELVTWPDCANILALASD